MGRCLMGRCVLWPGASYGPVRLMGREIRYLLFHGKNGNANAPRCYVYTYIACLVKVCSGRKFSELLVVVSITKRRGDRS